jgi:hypothetical protein
LYRSASIVGVRVAESVYWLGYGLHHWGLTPSRGREGIFVYATASRLALRSTQPCIEWVLGSGFLLQG